MAARLLDEWFGSARLAQYPVGATLRDIWLVLGGRGAGKTRLGAEWVHALVGGLSPFATYRYGRIALVGETLNDVREVRPLQIMTTTPRPVPLIRKLLRSERVTVTRMRTAENARNLSATFISAVEERYGGTSLGRQELDGELIEERAGALWTRVLLDEISVGTFELEAMRRVVVAVDPPASSRKSSDACGIIVAGIDEEGIGWVIRDATAQGLKPQDWARAVTSLYHRFSADCVVAEVNQGGDMVASVLGTADATVPVTPVRATRGKWTRAEPVAALYAQGRIRHAGRFPELEDEMCTLGPDGRAEGRSPDRVDALVWAISHLMLQGQAEPKIRSLY